MELIYNKCRICLENKNNLLSVYSFVEDKYLPALIYNISGVKIIKRSEPTAKICQNCKDALIIAETIILRCQESEEFFQYEKLSKMKQQTKCSSMESLNPESDLNEADVEDQNFFEDEIEEQQQVRKNTNNCSVCKVCAEQFPRKSSLYRHMQHIHNILPAEKKFHCNQCDKSYIKIQHLREHQMQKHHPRRFKCVAPNCQQSFTRAFTLRRHFLNAHQNEAKFYCTGGCNQQFKIYDHWNYHNKVVHNSKATCYL